MGYYMLLLPKESAWQILSGLGDTESVHFVDENP